MNILTLRSAFLLLIFGVSFLSFSVSVPAVSAAPPAQPYQNPLKWNTPAELLTSVLDQMKFFIVILAIIFLIVGAIMYITSGGNESRLTLAKGAITASMIGLALALAVPSFLKEISVVLGWTNAGAFASTTTLTALALKVLNFLLSIIGVLAIIMMVIGGILYVTAGGDENRVDTGKKIVLYSIVGVALSLASLALITQIAKFFA